MGGRPSALASIVLPPPGSSYNPAFDDHQVWAHPLFKITRTKSLCIQLCRFCIAVCLCITLCVQELLRSAVDVEETRLAADQKINKRLEPMEPMTASEREVWWYILPSCLSGGANIQGVLDLVPPELAHISPKQPYIL